VAAVRAVVSGLAVVLVVVSGLVCWVAGRRCRRSSLGLAPVVLPLGWAVRVVLAFKDFRRHLRAVSVVVA
jgi:hypothetical protein